MTLLARVSVRRTDRQEFSVGVKEKDGLARFGFGVYKNKLNRPPLIVDASCAHLDCDVGKRVGKRTRRGNLH